MSSVTVKKLFTPGPLLCSLSTKEAMLRDLGSRDEEFIATIKEIQNELLSIAEVPVDEWSAVPVQGSGTFALEAVFQTALPKTKQQKVLVLSNGAYGKRLGQMCQVMDLPCDVIYITEGQPITVQDLDKLKDKLGQYSLLSIVHCETSTGVFNAASEVAARAKQVNPSLLVFIDAMSSFGAVPLDLSHADFMVSSANKCLEGVPGFSFALCRNQALAACKGHSTSLCLDLYEQSEGLKRNGQFRFTPPTHALLAFRQALVEFRREGGLQARAKRYLNNREILQRGMTELGFKEFVAAEHSGYIITSYMFPSSEKFDFEAFYSKLSEKDQVIYPGKVTQADTFRIGNIGHLFPEDMRHLLRCIRQVLDEMDIAVPL